MKETRLIVQLPHGGALERELRTDPPPSIASGEVVLEAEPAGPGGQLEPPTVGHVVLSVPSPEALEREPETVRRVIDQAGSGSEPLIVEVEVAEHLRDEELAAVVDAAAQAPRPVILRIRRDD